MCDKLRGAWAGVATLHGRGQHRCSNAALRLAPTGPRTSRERLENLHPHFNIRMGRELGGPPRPLAPSCLRVAACPRPWRVLAKRVAWHPGESGAAPRRQPHADLGPGAGVCGRRAHHPAVHSAVARGPAACLPPPAVLRTGCSEKLPDSLRYLCSAADCRQRRFESLKGCAVRCCARAQRLTAGRARRMLFNWVLWRYTILYINERSWESGGVARTLHPVMSGPACLLSGHVCFNACSLARAWRHPGGWAPLRSLALRQIWRHFCQALIWCLFIFGIFTGAPPLRWRSMHASHLFCS
jgi:hypothetical protein